MDIPPNGRIIDIGCGPGRHSLELARRGFHPSGIDISPEFIKYASKTAAAENLNAEFLAADARELDSSQEFDGAILPMRGCIWFGR